MTANRTPRTAMIAAALALTMCGCTRVVDSGEPSTGPSPASTAAPISELQVNDLLSKRAGHGDGDLFSVVDPERCAGAAREVDPPLLQSLGPLTSTGGHWMTEVGRTVVEEMVAVYPSGFDAVAAMRTTRATIESCVGTTITVTTLDGDVDPFEVQAGAESPTAVLWALRNPDWNCDNAFVAAHNAAIEITTCSSAGGHDVAALAEQARQRIEALANVVA